MNSTDRFTAHAEDITFEPQANEYRIPAANLPGLRDKIERLNRRAARLSCPPVTLHVLRNEQVVQQQEDGTNRIEYYTVVAVEGARPVLNGWTFLATIDGFTDDTGARINMLRVVPGATVPERYRTATSECNHCRTARNRNNTYVVQHEDGTTVQVGSSCLRDFLGHADPAQVARWAELLSDLDYGLRTGEGFAGARGEITVGMDEFLGYVAAAVAKWGWTSRGTARERGGSATADDAWRAATERDARRREVHVEPQHAATAAEVVEWLDTLGDRDLSGSDYLWNLHAAYRRGAVAHRATGLLASALTAMQREREREIERAAERERAATSEHVGAVKERLVLDLTLLRERVLDGYYGGTSHLYMFADAQGNRFKWFASADQELKQGNTYRVRATIKAHEVYEGIKQTVLTRGKVEGRDL